MEEKEDNLTKSSLLPCLYHIVQIAHLSLTLVMLLLTSLGFIGQPNTERTVAALCINSSVLHWFIARNPVE